MDKRFICLRSDSPQIRREVLNRLDEFLLNVNEPISDNTAKHWAVIFDMNDYEVWEEPGIKIDSLRPRQSYYEIIHNKHRNDFYDRIIRELEIAPYSVYNKYEEVASFFCDSFLLHRKFMGTMQKDLLGQDVSLSNVNRDYLRKTGVKDGDFLASHTFHYDFHYDMLSYKDRYVIYKDRNWINTN